MVGRHFIESRKEKKEEGRKERERRGRGKAREGEKSKHPSKRTKEKEEGGRVGGGGDKGRNFLPKSALGRRMGRDVTPVTHPLFTSWFFWYRSIW